MATIRVSSLPEIQVDRITDDDYYIVNDGDITTSKLSFKQMVLGIAQKDIEFSGTIKFSGDVEFEANATGPFPNNDDVYTTDEIDVKVKILEEKDRTQDVLLGNLTSLSGEVPGSVVHTAFPKEIIIGTPTTRGALVDLEQNVFDNIERIVALELSKDSNNQEISEIATGLSDLEDVVNGLINSTSTDIIDLQERVGNAESTITNHEVRIGVNEAAVDELSKREFFFRALGYDVAYTNTATAAAGGVLIGDVYVQSLKSDLSDGVLKTRMS